MSPKIWFGSKNGTPTFAKSLFDRCRQVGKYLSIKFTIKYAVPDQIKLGMRLCVSIRTCETHQ